MRKINIACTGGRISAGEDQFSCECKRVLIRPLKHKRTGVGHDRRVEAGGNLGRDRDARFTSQPVNEFASGTGGGIDPIHVSERPAGLVVVDADKKLAVEAFEASALDTVTFENNGGLVSAIDRSGLDHRVRKRPRLVDTGYAIGQDDLSFFAHLAKDLGTGQDRSDGIAVGARVGSEHEALSPFDLLQYFGTMA